MMNKAQNTANPSDVTFLMTENMYTQVGLAMKKLNLPFRMRISREMVRDSNDLHYWNTWRFSLLIEPISNAILRVQQSGIISKFQRIETVLDFDINPNEWSGEQQLNMYKMTFTNTALSEFIQTFIFLHLFNVMIFTIQKFAIHRGLLRHKNNVLKAFCRYPVEKIKVDFQRHRKLCCFIVWANIFGAITVTITWLNVPQVEGDNQFGKEFITCHLQ